MNKKIKIIEIIQKYANGEQMPKTIKSGSSVFDYDHKDKTYYERGSDKCIYLSLDSFKELENEVEILEDNTEEIEELEEIEIRPYKGIDYNFQLIENNLHKLAKAVNQIRKDLNK